MKYHILADRESATYHIITDSLDWLMISNQDDLLDVINGDDIDIKIKKSDLRNFRVNIYEV